MKARIFYILILGCSLSGFAQVSISLTPNQPRQDHIGLGTNVPDPNSALDIVSPNKGVLYPQTILTSSTMQLTPSVTNPNGLWVYNTGGLLPKGYYFWDGTNWSLIQSISIEPPAIASLDCSEAFLAPATFLAGEPYVGQLIIPYSGGNGSPYDALAPIQSTGNTGLEASLTSGVLKSGDGSLRFSVSGTPSHSNNDGVSAAFNISFLGKNCVAEVGGFALQANRETRAVIGPFQTASNPSGAEVVVRSPNELYEARIFVPVGQNLDLADIQIRYIGPNAQSRVNWVGGWYTNAAGSGANAGGGTAPLVMDKDVWWGSNGGSNISGFANTALGNADVIYLGAPELRVYAWTDNSSSDNPTSYILTAVPTIIGSVSYSNRANTKITLILDQFDTTPTF